VTNAPIIPEFIGFSKIARYSREVIVTEKIDGTNGCLRITDDGGFFVGSRSRWITPENDNHGFARWAYGHKDELMKLGPGLHFGEWWGSGINRGYGLQKGEKRWSLFNVQRWCLFDQTPQKIACADPRIEKFQEVLPSCIGLVPIIWRGNFNDLKLEDLIKVMKMTGSVAVPGFMKPEGIVIFHVAGNVGFKKTLDDDDEPKSKFQKEAH